MRDVVHIIVGTFNARGGRELLALAFTKFFVEHKLGKRIILYTKDEPNTSITSTFPLEFVRVLKYVELRPLGMLYSKKLWQGIPYIRALQSTLTLNSNKTLTINLNANSIPIPAQICYVHFPYFGIGRDISLRSKVRK